MLKYGSVQNRFVQMSVSENVLQRIHNLLDDVVEGRTLGDRRELFIASRLPTDAACRATNCAGARHSKLGSAAVKEAVGGESDARRHGHRGPGEAARVARSFTDAGHRAVKATLRWTALDAREKLATLLELAIESKGGKVVVG